MILKIVCALYKGIEIHGCLSSGFFFFIFFPFFLVAGGFWGLSTVIVAGGFGGFSTVVV
jgi:hypothetical protein